MAKGRNWIEQTADRVEQRVRRGKGEGATVVCASGISPSGAIHLGNLRELMTVHLVSEELRRRGWTVDHLHSWDDYDRLRKVPPGVPESFAEHLGRPIAHVPDPGGELPSYADRFIRELEACAERLGVVPRYVRQSRAYPSGIYRELIKVAMAKRLEIFDVLAEYQTLDRHRKSREERRREYYPFRVYCESCDRDTTRITAYDTASATLTYTCEHGHGGSFSLDEKVAGKLVWKVDWPMRWRYEGVDFEPAGEDHSAPGSSRTVGQRIVREVFDAEAPYYVGYAFVGTSGASKMSSSTGTGATPAAALDIMEPAILRWLYARRNVRQSFSIDFGQEVLRLYDEWDRFVAAATGEAPKPAERALYETCVRTSAGEVAHAELPVSFRLLSSAADLTQGHLGQILRIVAEHLDEAPPAGELERRMEPRLGCAIRWATRYLPEEERTRVRDGFDTETWAGLDDEQRRGVGLFLERLDDAWGLEGLTRLVYGVPKLVHGLDLDADPTPEIKRAQRAFFVALYSLLVGSDTGPRLPTLLLSLGREKVRELLAPPAADGG